jgi:hypothetical protein
MLAITYSSQRLTLSRKSAGSETIQFSQEASDSVLIRAVAAGDHNLPRGRESGRPPAGHPWCILHSRASEKLPNALTHRLDLEAYQEGANRRTHRCRHRLLMMKRIHLNLSALCALSPNRHRRIEVALRQHGAMRGGLNRNTTVCAWVVRLIAAAVNVRSSWSWNVTAQCVPDSRSTMKIPLSCSTIRVPDERLRASSRSNPGHRLAYTARKIPKRAAVVHVNSRLPSRFC